MAIYQQSIDVNFSYPRFNFLKKWLKTVLSLEKLNCGDINILFTSDNYLLKLNQEYLNHDYFTDVISFDYTVGQNISGDIFISIDRVKDNSVTYRVKYLDEMDRVIIHGILHLMGYNDSVPGEMKLIREKEDQYLLLR